MNEQKTTSDKKLRFSYEIKIPFCDLDAMGHVNNASFITYLETTRTEFYSEAFNITKYQDFQFILGDIYCRYLSPAYMNENLVISLCVGEIGSRSFKFEYLISEKTTGRIVCEARTTQIMFDYKNQKTFQIPDDVKNILKKYRLQG
jgi:acyl-CoA thioester hydrolase